MDMTDLKLYFSTHMWKMSSYNWRGIWMRDDGQPLNNQESILGDPNTQVVGQIKFSTGEREGLQRRIAEALEKGGWKPGDPVAAARIALKQHCQGYINQRD